VLIIAFLILYGILVYVGMKIGRFKEKGENNGKSNAEGK